MKDVILETSNLTKVYGKHTILDNVNMHIKKGDIYGFIGKNGAGKTTLMRIVTGLANPTSGSITLFGSLKLEEQCIRIGTSVEMPGLYLNMTAYQNMEVVRLLLGIPSKENIVNILELVGLGDTKNKKVKNFSLGMKQRLGIAITLIGNPDFLILDEPINGLDPTGIKEVRDLLVRLNKEKQITILISSHILGELAKVATCYGIINNGKLVDEFTKEELEVRCRRSLRINVDDTKKAVTILETICHVKEYDIVEENTIRLFENIDDAGYINTALSNNGVVVSSIAAVRQDLENYFMERMGGKEND